MHIGAARYTYLWPTTRYFTVAVMCVCVCVGRADSVYAVRERRKYRAHVRAHQFTVEPGSSHFITQDNNELNNRFYATREYSWSEINREIYLRLSLRQIGIHYFSLSHNASNF